MAKKERRWRTRQVAPARLMPGVELSISTQPERRSPMTKQWRPLWSKKSAKTASKGVAVVKTEGVVLLPVMGHSCCILCSSL